MPTTKNIDDKLLATHIAKNPNFESACMSGDGLLIMDIVETEMQKNNLFTKGSKKLKEDITRMLRGQSRVPASVGERVLFFVWNSRMSGNGYAVG